MLASYAVVEVEGEMLLQLCDNLQSDDDDDEKRIRININIVARSINSTYHYLVNWLVAICTIYDSFGAAENHSQRGEQQRRLFTLKVVDKYSRWCDRNKVENVFEGRDPS